MSECGVSGSPTSSSGDTYGGDEVTGRPLSEPATRVATPKSERYGVSVSVEQDVCGLDVPVDDTLAVGIGECARHRRHHASGRLKIPWASVERLPQRPSAQPAHHEVRPVWVPPVVVERNEVRMLELGDLLRLRLESADERWLVDELRPDGLDCHLTPDRGLVGAVDDAEVAAADLLAELVPAHRATERTGQDGRRQAVDSQGREVGREALDEKLEDVLRASDALEPERAQSLRLPAAARRRERRVRLRREQHLAPCAAAS